MKNKGGSNIGRACFISGISIGGVLYLGYLFVLLTSYKQSFDSLSVALWRTTMYSRHNTLIITFVNGAYAQEDGMLDLFLESLRSGKDTRPLIRHLLIVTFDRTSSDRCRKLHNYCYNYNEIEGGPNGADQLLSDEKLYMTPGFIDLRWKRTRFLRDVIRRGYSFVFTDADVLWFRNPFPEFTKKDDLQISVDWYNGEPYDMSNMLNTGFYFVQSNEKTIRLYNRWYESRYLSKGMKDQDVLQGFKSAKAFERLDLKLRFLDTRFFSGFCQKSDDMKAVIVMHANCCQTIKAKLADLKGSLEDFRNAIRSTEAANSQLVGNISSNIVSPSTWSISENCHRSMGWPVPNVTTIL